MWIPLWSFVVFWRLRPFSWKAFLNFDVFTQITLKWLFLWCLGRWSNAVWQLFCYFLVVHVVRSFKLCPKLPKSQADRGNRSSRRQVSGIYVGLRFAFLLHISQPKLKFAWTRLFLLCLGLQSDAIWWLFCYFSVVSVVKSLKFRSKQDGCNTVCHSAKPGRSQARRQSEPCTIHSAVYGYMTFIAHHTLGTSREACNIHSAKRINS